MPVTFSPNGSEEYKQVHEVEIIPSVEAGEIKSIKYQWTESIEEKPADELFTEEYTIGEKISKGEVTGRYYLWALVENNYGVTNKSHSEAFYFDNEGPEVVGEIKNNEKTRKSFSIDVTVKDEYVAIGRYEIWIGDNKVAEKASEGKLKKETVNILVENLETGEYDCVLKIYDTLGNKTTKEFVGKTKPYVWNVYNYQADGVVDSEITEINHARVDTTITQGYYAAVPLSHELVEGGEFCFSPIETIKHAYRTDFIEGKLNWYLRGRT